MDSLRELLDSRFLLTWGSLAVLCLVVLGRDLKKNNPEMGGMMKVVWGLTVLYSGVIGLLLYYWSGRKQIARDSLWRKGARSVAHCYSGCGLGEVVGLVLTVGILAASQPWVIATTASLAYCFGLALTVGPLLHDGMELSQAMKDAIVSETASIVVMEAVAISVDLVLAGDATMGEPLFWGSLIVSLSLGLLAAYPVNALLIHYGVKEGMHNPKHAAAH